MARIFITGSTEGLGLAAGRSLLEAGHEVVLHARTAERASALADLVVPVVVGDLSRAADVRGVAEQVNALGRMDAVIHNAGVYNQSSRNPTPESHAATFAVNTLAPYMLTALIERPDRLVYMSSGLHRGGEGSLVDLDWTKRRWNGGQAYAESKLQIVALAFALARRWPGTLVNAVDPGWVRTRMGGPGATLDIDTGQRTQSWLAGSDDAAAKVSGRYWHAMKTQAPAAEAADPAFQEALLARLEVLTGVRLP